MGFIEKTVNRMSNWGGLLGEFFLAVVVVITLASVVSRALHFALPGIFDLIETFLVVSISFSLVKAEMKNHHTRADILVNRMGRRTKAWVESITKALGLVVWIVITWASVKLTAQKWESGEATEFLKLPVPPFRGIWTVACALLCIILLIKVVRHIKEGVSK